MKLNQFKSLILNMPEPYQAFTSEKSTWKRYLRRVSVGQALGSILGRSSTVTISRSDLRSIAKSGDIKKLVLSTIIWGYPGGMRGRHVSNLIKGIDDIEEALTSAKSIKDWASHYKSVEQIRGLGLSTYSKLLSFLPAKITGLNALILDDRIIRVVSSDVFDDFNALRTLKSHNAVSKYPQYLSEMHKIASRLAVPAQNLEFFLFEFGLNLKPPNVGHGELT